jgi:hypothetical protein
MLARLAIGLLKDFRVQLVLVALFGLAVGSRRCSLVTLVRPQGDQNYWHDGTSPGWLVCRNNVGWVAAVHPPLYSATSGSLVPQGHQPRGCLRPPSWGSRQ